MEQCIVVGMLRACAVEAGLIRPLYVFVALQLLGCNSPMAGVGVVVVGFGCRL